MEHSLGAFRLVLLITFLCFTKLLYILFGLLLLFNGKSFFNYLTTLKSKLSLQIRL